MLYYNSLDQGWRARSHAAGVGCGPTNYTTTRSDILSEGTCSAPSLQTGRGLPRGWTYRKENHKHCHTVNECRVRSSSPDLPHDFLPSQAYLIFRGKINKAKEGKYLRRGLPRPAGSEGSHRRRWWWLQLNNTGRNRSFSIEKSDENGCAPFLRYWEYRGLKVG